MDHVRVQELKPSGRDSGVSWGPVWGEPAGLPTWPPAGETLRPFPSLGEILPVQPTLGCMSSPCCSHGSGKGQGGAPGGWAAVGGCESCSWRCRQCLG